MSNPREIAINLYHTAIKANIKFPKVWDQSKCIQTCGAILVRYIIYIYNYIHMRNRINTHI